MNSLLKYISIAQIFAMALCAVVFSILPNLVSYKEYMTIIGIISFVVALYFITYHSIVRNAVLRAAFISYIVIFLYWITSMFYISDSVKYNSFFLVLIGQFFPISILASIVAKMVDVQEKIKKFVPWLSLLFTITSFVAAFFPSDITSGGYAMNYNGLNYQSISYMAAYASSMSVYYLIGYGEVDWPLFFKNKHIKFIIIFSLLLNLITIFIAGGRGGLVLECIVILYFLHKIRKYKNGPNSLYKQIGLLSAIILGIVGCLYFAKFSSIQTNGFQRILAMVFDGDTNGRSQLKDMALSVYSDNPIFGHGLGSVFFEVGEYSHNILLDILVETGLVGLLSSVLLFFYMVKNLKNIILIDKSNMLWALIFIDGFVMSLFSGYYLGSCPLIWTLFLLISFPKIES